MCLTDVDPRPACDFEPAPVRANRAAQAKWLSQAGLTERPLLRLTVDAREPRVVLLATSRLAFHDSCADFEEVDVDSHTATLRRLALPLGTASLVVRVPVASYTGTEYAAVTASSEAKAAAWLRSRSQYRWTLGAKGELEPSFQLDDRHFTLEPDVTGVTWATPPAKRCDCDDE